MDQPNLMSYEGYRTQKSQLVPLKFSREAWFDFCMEHMTHRLEEVAKDQNNDNLALELLEILVDLLLVVDQRSKSERELNLYLDVLCALVPLIESNSSNVRKRSQLVLSSIVDCLDCICQVKALCHLFQSVAARKFQVQMEPQVLAWFMDLFRWRLSLSGQEGQCRQVFRANLSAFYELIGSVVYEDVVLANQFYVAVLLLMEEQALQAFDMPLLREVKNKLLEKFQTQLAEYDRLKGVQLNLGSSPVVRQEIFSLELLKFTVTDARRKIDRALVADKK